MSRILIIDDEVKLLSGFARILSSKGYEVVTADNGVDGLRLAKESSFDLVLTDILMPGVEGIEVCMVLKKTHPSLPVIAMSGCPARSTYLEIARLLGAKRVLQKPISSADLTEVIGEVLSA